MTAFIVYCLFIVWYTVLSREATPDRAVRWELFWAYRDWLAGLRTGKAEVIQNLKNILFFLPFGLLFPWKKRGWAAVLFAALLLSASVEAAQYFRGCGLCELDDVICNTLGALLGFGAWIIMKRIVSDAAST